MNNPGTIINCSVECNISKDQETEWVYMEVVEVLSIRKQDWLPQKCCSKDCLEHPTSLLKRQGPFSMTAKQEPRLGPLKLLNIKVQGSGLDGLAPKLENNKSCSDLENTCWSLTVIITPLPLIISLFCPFLLFQLLST